MCCLASPCDRRVHTLRSSFSRLWSKACASRNLAAAYRDNHILLEKTYPARFCSVATRGGPSGSPEYTICCGGCLVYGPRFLPILEAIISATPYARTESRIGSGSVLLNPMVLMCPALCLGSISMAVRRAAGVLVEGKTSSKVLRLRAGH